MWVQDQAYVIRLELLHWEAVLSKIETKTYFKELDFSFSPP